MTIIQSYPNIRSEIEIIIKEIKENFMIKYDDKYQLYESIESLIKPTEQAKKQNAEILTPLFLAQEMCSKIPIKFFNSPQAVFDPCCGKGVFSLLIYDLFWNNLLIKNEKERRRVILEECIYFADINPLNIFITKYLLDPLNQYKLKYHCGDTLTLNIAEEFKVDGFNLVIGNPPYNKNNTGTGNSLWQYFVNKALDELILSNGYLIFVHPSGWRKPCYEKSQLKKYFNLMCKTNQLHYLEIHNASDGMKVFNAGTRYDWYLIEKTKKYKNTIIKDELRNINEIDLSNWEWLPNYNILDIEKLLGVGCDVICNSSYHATRVYVQETQTDKFKYLLIHSTPKSGIRYMYSSKNDLGHFGVPKVIFGEAGINHVIIDMDGVYGMTQGAIAIKVNFLEEAENYKKALLSKKFKSIILNSCSFGNFRIDWRLFKFFKKDFWLDFIEDDEEMNSGIIAGEDYATKTVIQLKALCLKKKLKINSKMKKADLINVLTV